MAGWKKGESGNRSGRPRGAVSRQQFRDLLEEHFDEALEALMIKVREADTTALRIFFDRICPALKPAEIDMPPPKLKGTLRDRAEQVLDALSRGELRPEDARNLTQSLHAVGAVIETHDLAERLEALEEAVRGRRAA